MPQLELSSMGSLGCVNLGGQRLAMRVSPSPCGAELISVLAPKSVIPRPSERPAHVGIHLPARDLVQPRPWMEIAVSCAEPLLGPTPPQGRCLAGQRHPRCIHDCKPVPARYQTYPETRDPLITPDSVHAVRYSPSICHYKASTELGYVARPLLDTMRDTYAWFEEYMPPNSGSATRKRKTLAST